MKIVILSSLVFSVLLHQYQISKNNYIAVAAFDPVTAIINNLKCKLQKDRVLLEWIMNNNHLVKQIEVEVSADGRNYAMAGLVFSTDRKESDPYHFHENAEESRIYYRLKIIHKDQTIRYSEIVSPG